MITKVVSDDHYLVLGMGHEGGDKKPFCTHYTAIFFKPTSGWFFIACKPEFALHSFFFKNVVSPPRLNILGIIIVLFLN